MKVLFLGLVALFLVSCGDDRDEQPSVATPQCPEGEHMTMAGCVKPNGQLTDKL